jgi:hypothetical protein
MAENNLAPDSNSIKSDEVYLSETEKNITICESIDETLEDNKTSNERNVSNVSQENLSWKGNEKIHKIADKEQKLSDFINSLKSTEHPIQGPENKPCLLESLPENVQQCKERKCEMSQSLESNVEKTCTTGIEESITDTGKNENDSGSKSVERIEHPSQKHGNDAFFLEPLLEKSQPCKGKEFEMSKSIELNVDKICTACEDEHKIETDQEKKEDDSESKLLESIEHLTQKHGNDACLLQPVPEKAQPFEERESEMSKSIELKVDKIWRASAEESTIRTDKKIIENDPESKSLESIESPLQDHGNDACFLEPVPEEAQACEEEISETSKSLKLNVDKTCTTGTEESTIKTYQERNEYDSASKSVESIEPPIQEHGNDARIFEPVLGMVMTCEDREFETSKSLEPNIDKTCIACEEEPTIETDQERHEGDSASNNIKTSIERTGRSEDSRETDQERHEGDSASNNIKTSIERTGRSEDSHETDQERHEGDSASNNIKTSIKRTGRSEDSQINEKSSIVWNTQTENKNFSESGKLAATKNEEEFEKSTDLKSAQTNCEVNNRPFRFTKAEQFIGDSCTANPFSVNIRRPVSKRLPKRKLNKATKSATYVLNETVYCTNHCLPVRYWCHQCNAAKCGICVNVVNSRTCANHLDIIMSEHVAKLEVCKYCVLSLHKDALLVVQILRFI